VNHQANANSLRCSVIVPVYNGVATIPSCLDALATQTTPSEQYEVIIVDDGSKDATASLVREWIAAHPQLQARLVQQANAGPAAARNHGAQVAQSDLLLFTDADCAPTPTWIAAMLAGFTQPDVVGIKGAYLTNRPAFTPRFVQLEYEDRYDRMRQQPSIDFIDTYSAGYRRDVFLANGGFDATFTTASVEDQEFSFRLAQKGYELRFVPDAQVYHAHDRDVWDYARRKYLIGYWKALLTRWHPERMVHDSHTPQALKLQILLLVGILGLLPLALAGLIWPLLDWLWLPVIGLILAFIGTALPFLTKVVQKAPTMTPGSVGMLFVRALALGIGFVAGTIRFAGAPAELHQPVIPGWKRFIKRMVDIVGALVGLVISAPIIAVAAIAIKLDSPGSVFYWQTRIGEYGRPFRIVKLRSMVSDADEQLTNLVDLERLPEPVYKIANDPRVTRVGRLLRRASLDETPQFYNVLIGDMSLVGPRPEDARIVELYEDFQRRRLAVKPGLTGPMQVNGRGNLSLTERLRLELDYIENYSLRRDFSIILRTLPAIIRGDGAY
jgi:lipopolysaccharide/colanic/teichoic acid biosynthesis glycosyltransferase/GT2 family glycosyltransferase